VFSQKIRKGRSLVTIMTDEYQECRFHEVDNLDTKTIDEAENNYEKTFIVVRDFLEQKKDGQHNLVSETARLSLAQGVTDLLRQGGLIRKEPK